MESQASNSPGVDAKQIHAESIVIDAHADIVVPGLPAPYVGLDGRSKVVPDKLEAGGVDAVALALYAPPGVRDAAGYAKARRIADKQLAAVHEMVDDPANRSRIVHTADEVVQARSDGLRAVILGFQNALIIGQDVSVLGEFYEAGVRVFALNHIGHNDYADLPGPPTWPRFLDTNLTKNTVASRRSESKPSSSSTASGRYLTLPNSRETRHSKY